MISKRQILTQPQIDFVKFLGNRNISDNEMVDIKRLISNYYVLKADMLMENIWNEKKLDQQSMMNILNTVLK